MIQNRPCCFILVTLVFFSSALLWRLLLHVTQLLCVILCNPKTNPIGLHEVPKPLAMPLPLVRITSAWSASYVEPSDAEGSVVDQFPLVFRSRPSQVTQPTGTFSRRTGKKNMQLTRTTEADKPDVIVN